MKVAKQHRKNKVVRAALMIGGVVVIAVVIMAGLIAVFPNIIDLAFDPLISFD